MSSIFALSGRVYEAITDELEVARLAMVADTDADAGKRTEAIARLARSGRFAPPEWRPSALAKNTEPAAGACPVATPTSPSHEASLVGESAGSTLPCLGKFARHRFLGHVHCQRGCGAIQARPDRVETVTDHSGRQQGAHESEAPTGQCASREQDAKATTPAGSVAPAPSTDGVGQQASTATHSDGDAGSSPAAVPLSYSTDPIGALEKYARDQKHGCTQRYEEMVLCACGHPDGWHRHGNSACLECSCPEFRHTVPYVVGKHAARDGSTIVVGKRAVEEGFGKGTPPEVIYDADAHVPYFLTRKGLEAIKEAESSAPNDADSGTFTYGMTMHPSVYSDPDAPTVTPAREVIAAAPTLKLVTFPSDRPIVIEFPDYTDRRNYIGSGDIAAIVGASKRSGPMDVYLAKVLPAEEEEGEEAEWLRMGRALQPVIADEVCRRLSLCRLNNDGEEAEVYDPARPYLRAHIDNVAVDKDDRNVVIESKATGPWAVEWRDLEEDECSQAALVQVTYQTALYRLRYPKMGTPRMFVARFLNLGVRVYELEYDPELGDLLLDAADRFWREHVLAKRPPPLDGSEASKTYLRRRFPKSNGHTRPPLPEERALADLLRDATRRRDDAAEDVARLRAKLAACIGDFDGLEGLATLRDGGSATAWKAVALEAGAVGDLIAKHTKSRGRTLRLLGEKEGD